MFITYSRALHPITLYPEQLEDVVRTYCETGSPFCENLMSNLTYIGRSNSAAFDTWNTIIEAITGNPIKYSSSRLF